MKGLALTVALMLPLVAPAANAFPRLGRGHGAMPQAGACLEQRDLDGAAFVVRFAEHPDEARHPSRVVLRFAPGSCSDVESGRPRALRVYPGQGYDLIVATPEGSATSTVQLRRRDGSLAAFLGRVRNDWLADSEPIALGPMWLLSQRGEKVLYGTGELTPLPGLPDALAQAAR